MIKYLFLFILGLLVFNIAFAQKRDTVVYYLNASGKVVSAKDSADFFLVILPPDTSVDKKLFIVKEFYRNGKIRLIGNSMSKNLKNLKFQGAQITFFPNGHKMRVENFENGEPVDDGIEYYPNGRLYKIISYAPNKNVFLKPFTDSTGNVLAENGTGKWIEFNESFNEIYSEGSVSNGVADGTWHGKINDSVGFESIFNKGTVISSIRIYRYKNESDTCRSPDVIPEFPGGLEAFNKFIGNNVRYPALARENGVQGIIIIGFVVEKDGTISNIKVARGIGDGCDQEAIRVIKLCPPWKAGMQNGKPVRVAYSVPISFSLDNQTSKVIKGDSTINKEFSPVEQVPEFPGGLEAFFKFIGAHLQYPSDARRNGTQGRVIVSFVVERDGSLTDVKVARGIGDGCDEEAVRLIKSSPRWKPGTQNGKPVRVLYRVPISFSLDN